MVCQKHPYEKMVLSGRGYIPTEASSIISENNRNVILLDNHGKHVAFCHLMMDSLTATKYHMAQYDTFRDEEKSLKYLAVNLFFKFDNLIIMLNPIKGNTPTLENLEF